MAAGRRWRAVRVFHALDDVYAAVTIGAGVDGAVGIINIDVFDGTSRRGVGAKGGRGRTGEATGISVRATVGR